MAREGLADSRPVRVGAFASRPFSAGDATRALDSTINGLRTLGTFATPGGEPMTTVTDLADIVGRAREGMASYLPRESRRTFHAMFLAVGQRCRAILERATAGPALAQVSDPVVAAALRRHLGVDAQEPATTLLRLAVAAELSGPTTGRTGGGHANPLRGVLDLYEMGALLTPGRDGRDAQLTLAGGDAIPLEWTGSLFWRGAAGRLRPVQTVDLSY